MEEFTLRIKQKGQEKMKDKIYLFLKKHEGKIGIDLPYFVKNGFLMTLRQLVDLSIGMVLFVVFARVATKEALGYYQYVVSVFAVVVIISIPGLNISILRAVARGYDGEYVPSVKKSFVWSLLGVPVILLLGIYYYVFGDEMLGVILMTSSVFFPFYFAPNTWSYFLQGKEKYGKLNLYASIQSSITAIITILVIYLSKSNALAITIIYLFSFSLFGIIFYYKSLKYIENDKSSGDALSYGWFLTKINFFNFIAENADKVIIGSVLSPTLLAVFTVISSLPFKLRLVIKSIFSVAFPKMSQDNFRMIKFFKSKEGKRLLVLSSIFVLVIGAIYYFTVEPVSRLLFGEKYNSYYYYGKYFSFLVVIYIPLLITNWYLQAKKMSKEIFYVNLVSFIVKIISMIAGVKIWGIVGGIWFYNANMLLLLMMQLGAIYIKESKPGENSLALELS